jgi:hypothetical protein
LRNYPAFLIALKRKRKKLAGMIRALPAAAKNIKNAA